MNERPGFFERVQRIFAGKGYYMVLLGCLAALGLSGFYLWHTVSDQPETELADAQAQVEVETGGEAEVEVSNAETQQTIVSPPIQVTAPEPEPEPKPEPEVIQEAPVEETVVPQPVPEPQPVTHQLQWPVEGEITAAFSATELTYNPILEDWRTHDGVDLSADVGTQVSAAADGSVSSITRQPATGTTLTIRHENGLQSVYGNLNPDTLCVAEGDSVRAGDILGCVGSTGDGEAPCLHFAVLEDGVAVDPMEFLQQ